MTNKIIEFLRKKDFQLIKELGKGACGKTVLLYDDIINEQFVCKKYAPHFPEYKEILFKNFIREIKLLHLIAHKNIVRVFNYYIYPEQHAGYILMEYVEGTDIESFLIEHPENINEIFAQTIEGFSYTESNNILHRDIRPLNIMVTSGGIVKIIDFGFGKRIHDKNDFDKSITLNWWCEPPNEFNEEVYDFNTEVYFVGKLFEKIIRENNIEHFKYMVALSGMCKPDPEARINKFFDIKKGILSDKFVEIEFSEKELDNYRKFSSALSGSISKIERGTKYFDDIENIQPKISELYKSVMLEEYIPDNTALIRCFVNGSYYFNKSYYIPISIVKSFLELLRSCSKEKRNIILSNLHSKLDAIERYEETPDFGDDIPF